VIEGDRNDHPYRRERAFVERLSEPLPNIDQCLG